MDSAGSVINDLGNTVWANPDDARGQAILATGANVNPKSLKLWSLALKLTDWDTIIDVGSNYGEMLAGVELPPTARIVAFEPNTTVLPYLERTLSGLSTPVELVKMAVADRAGQLVPFYRDENWSGTSGFDPNPGAENLALDHVQVTTLNDFLGDSSAESCCIKVDVEGADLAVLAGSLEILARLSRWSIMIEVLHMSDEEVLLLAERYNLFFMDPRSQRLVRIQPEDPETVRVVLDSGWLYPQDALLISSVEMVIR